MKTPDEQLTSDLMELVESLEHYNRLQGPDPDEFRMNASESDKEIEEWNKILHPDRYK